MGNQIRRHIGRILLDGGFLSKKNLARACEEQKCTRELLGQVLVRMGVLKPQEINAPLLVQEHLSSVDDAVRIAAGERQLLGALLVQSGRITSKQLDCAIAEQKWTGEKLGEVFTRLGMLTERQLVALLEFQHHQEETATSTPLRLGELLVATGYISRNQLEDALQKQKISHKKIGEVLVEEGYVSSGSVKSGFRLQKMLVSSVLAAILSLSMSAPGFASSVNLQWDANTETDIAGYKMYYSPESSPLEGTVPVNVGNLTTTTISGLDPDIAYKFAVTAYNTSGLESTFSNVLPVAEQLSPTVAITSPADSANVSGVVSLNVTASDNVGVTKVEFYVNGVLKASETGATYFYSWDTASVAPGAYTLMAKAYDAAGNVSQSSRSVTVVNDLVPPTVALTSPANNVTVSGTVTISSSASDNVGVARVEFYSNGALLYASNAPPYSFSWDTRSVENGSYEIIAKAYDNATNTAQSSSATVLVSNIVPDVILPDVIAPLLGGFTLPASATSLTVPVSGLIASDNIGVTGYLITESATAPSVSASGWSASAPASYTFASAGTKTAYAWAKDATG
ncbi:MAG: fibronectin type III domain-containing protein, partial [Deltaproteobacteria bacterium]|nr:fibronectin type III domain-containing protein [Deltaproteobacteria bacterium]